VNGTFFATGGGGRAAGPGSCGCEGRRELRRQEVAKRRRNAAGRGRRRSIAPVCFCFAAAEFAAGGVGLGLVGF